MQPSRQPSHRPLAEQYDQWMEHLRRHVVSRRTMSERHAGAPAGTLVPGAAPPGGSLAGAAASAATIADGFLVNGRHLSFGNDPRTQMWVGGHRAGPRAGPGGVLPHRGRGSRLLTADG